MQDLSSTPLLDDPQVPDIMLQETERPVENAHTSIRSPGTSTSSSTSNRTVATDSAQDQSPNSSFTPNSSTIRFLQQHSSPRLTGTPNLQTSSEPFISPLLESAPPSNREHTIVASPDIISTNFDASRGLSRSPYTNGPATPTVPMRPSSLPLDFGRNHSITDSRSSTPSFVPERPERRTSRVRWDIPEVPTDSAFSPVSPPPSTAPTYPGLVTPLWTSTPPALRAFPLVAPNPAATPSPWYHNTPHPLPIFPHITSSGYGPINRPVQAYSDLPDDDISNSTSSPLVSHHHRTLPEFTPGAPHMESYPLPTSLGAHGSNHTSLGQPQYIPQGVYTLSEQIHSRFFLQDGNIDFRVNNVLFRVHRHFFFPNAKALLLIGPVLPPVIDLSVFGFSHTEFALLLSIFYPRTIGTYEIQGVQGWSTILKVANLLNFRDIRNLAIKRLAGIASPVDRILLARKYDIQRWLVPAFKELCTRTEPLTDEEGRKLGVEGLMVLSRMKHELQSNFMKYLDSVVVDEMVRALTDLDV